MSSEINVESSKEKIEKGQALEQAGNHRPFYKSFQGELGGKEHVGGENC